MAIDLRIKKRKVQMQDTILSAHQWNKNGDHPLDYSKTHEGLETKGKTQRIRKFSAAYRKQHDWEGDIVRYFRHPSTAGREVCPACSHTFHDHGWIDHGSSGHMVCPGDIIIQAAKDKKFYPIKPQVFSAIFWRYT